MKNIIESIIKHDGFVPAQIHDYLLEAAPPKTIEAIGCRIFGGMSFVAENYHASPSMFIRKFGHWTIARFDDGNAVCLDIDSHLIRVFDVGEFIGRKDNEGFVMMKSSADNKLHKVPCDKNNILCCVKMSFASLRGFFAHVGL